MSASRTLKGILWLGATNVVTKLLWALATILLMHRLGPEAFGQLISIWAIAELAAAASDLGATQSMLRSGSGNAAHLASYLRAVLTVKGGLGVIFWAAISAALLLGGVGRGAEGLRPADAALLVALAVGAPLADHFSTVFAAVTQVLHRLDVFALWRIAYFAAALAAFALVTGLGGGLVAVAGAHLGLALVAALLFGAHCRSIVPRQEQDAVPYPIGLAVREGLPFLFATLLALAYYRTDIMLLRSLGSPYEAGIYGGQYLVVPVFYMVPGMVFGVMLPDLYRNCHNAAYMQHRFDLACRYLNLLALLAVPCLVFRAADVVQLLGGSEFAEHYPTLQVLAFMIPLFIFSVSLNFLTAFNRMPYRIGCEVAGIAFTVLAGVFVVPRYSATGMAVVAVLAFCVSGFLALRELALRHAIFARTAAADAAGMTLRAAPALGVFFLPVGSPWLQCALYVVAAIAMLTALGFWKQEDRDVISALRAAAVARGP